MWRAVFWPRLENPSKCGSMNYSSHRVLGIGVFPNDGEDIDTLLKHTGIAMHHAKRRGKNTYDFYSKEMNTRSVERLSLETELRKALSGNELLLHYQPKTDIRTGRITGMEALLRWQHPERGWISPVEFIPLAEEIGFITPLGEWVLHTACTQIKAWQSAGLAAQCMAVNVSSHQFRHGEFIGVLKEALGSSGLDPKHLALELTENVIMENEGENIEALHQIKEMGVKLSVDDFGTGYSSLSYLRRLPLDELKIDRSFITEVDSNEDDASIVAAILAMARRLGLTVVAEGVETEQQLAYLRAEGCQEYQGYLFSKPVPADELAALLANQ